MKVSNTSQRLKEVMATKGLKQIDVLNQIKPLCKKYNIKLGSNDLSQYVTGKVIPSQKKLSLLAEFFGTNEVWLMGYDVSPEQLNYYKSISQKELKQLIKVEQNEINKINKHIKTLNSLLKHYSVYKPYDNSDKLDMIDTMLKDYKKLLKYHEDNFTSYNLMLQNHVLEKEIDRLTKKNLKLESKLNINNDYNN